MSDYCLFLLLLLCHEKAVCYGTRAALEALDQAGITQGVTHMAVAGGATRSPLWLQMHSDVTGLPVVVGNCVFSI